jgi:hypothetical protein
LSTAGELDTAPPPKTSSPTLIGAPGYRDDVRQGHLLHYRRFIVTNRLAEAVVEVRKLRKV